MEEEGYILLADLNVHTTFGKVISGYKCPDSSEIKKDFFIMGEMPMEDLKKQAERIGMDMENVWPKEIYGGARMIMLVD